MTRRRRYVCMYVCMCVCVCVCVCVTRTYEEEEEEVVMPVVGGGVRVGLRLALVGQYGVVLTLVVASSRHVAFQSSRRVRR